MGAFFVGAFFPVYLNLVSGNVALDRRLLEVGQVFRVEGIGLVRRLIPASLILFAILGKATDRGLEALGARWSRWRAA